MSARNRVLVGVPERLRKANASLRAYEALVGYLRVTLTQRGQGYGDSEILDRIGELLESPLSDEGLTEAITLLKRIRDHANSADDPAYLAQKALDAIQRGPVVLDEAVIARAADAIGALGTDRIGAEPYASARAILDAALGGKYAEQT